MLSINIVAVLCFTLLFPGRRCTVAHYRADTVCTIIYHRNMPEQVALRTQKMSECFSTVSSLVSDGNLSLFQRNQINI